MTYATVCSGIECMSVASWGLPLKPVFFSEIEPFPCAVLKAHYPEVPNLGDMSKIQVTNQTEITNGTINIRLHERLDILAGGTPCQDVSVAGKRAGMAEGGGTRSSLAFEFARLARELRPNWILWENVAGCIDSKNAPDFLRFAATLGECGYACCWRVLDAQYVRVDGMERAVPQRRRRVWLVGHLGADVGKVAKVLFEHDSIVGDNPPRRRTGQGFAYSLGGRNQLDARLVGETVALDGDKLKPREDQRKGGNGFGVNEEGAGYTLTAVDRHGVAYAADGGEVAATITRQIAEQSGQDNRVNAVVECFENHGQDSRVKPIEVSDTRNQKDGTGGNNLPLVVHKSQVPFVKTSHACGKGGLGEKWQQCEVAGTRNAIEGGDGRNQEAIVSMAQNTRDEVRIIGGEAIGIAKDAFNSGTNSKYNLNVSENVAPTITGNTGGGAGGATAYDRNPQGGQMMPFSHESGNKPSVSVASDIASMRYIVRRLTPTECERLMGLPDGYTIPAGLDPNDPSLVAEFQQIFDAFGAIMAEYAHTKPPKPKSAKAVAKWLANVADPETCPDSPRYKACGNGWATNQPRWILCRMLVADGIDPFEGSEK